MPRIRLWRASSLEQERPGLGQELPRIVEPADLHRYSSSSTRAEPPATRSPATTWTVFTVAS